MKKGINVLSCFDGMSCGQIALERAGIKVNEYYASEIDKYAIKVTMANYPNTIQLGVVEWVDEIVLPKIDLILAGSPCQGFSFAGKQLNFNDPRSKLFFEFVRLLDQIKVLNPDVVFLLENVKMKKEYQDVISGLLGVEPIEINSNLVSAQNRKRLYWTNIPNVGQPSDLKIYLNDILEINPENQVIMSPTTFQRFKGYGIPFVTSETLKARCLCAEEYVKNGKQGNYVLLPHDQIRKLTPIECERLQNLPDNYTLGVSNTQRYRMTGNGWTVNAVAHILSSWKQN